MSSFLFSAFRQSRPTGNNPGRPPVPEREQIFALCRRSTRTVDRSEFRALGFSGSTARVDRSGLQSSRLFRVDRLCRPCVDLSPRSGYLNLSLSHFFLTRPTSSSFPLFSKTSPNPITPKFLQNPSSNHSGKVGSSVSRLLHHQISRISDLGLGFSHLQVKITFLL